jgi:hypothetical protein
MYMIETCAFFWNFRENVNVLKNSLLKMSNSILLGLGYYLDVLESPQFVPLIFLVYYLWRTYSYYLGRLYFKPYNRLSGQQMLSGTQIISTSHGMTGRKNEIRKAYDIPDKPPLYFSTGIRIANILHARLRQKCNNLKCDLFRCNLIAYP